MSEDRGGTVKLTAAEWELFRKCVECPRTEICEGCKLKWRTKTGKIEARWDHRVLS